MNSTKNEQIAELARLREYIEAERKKSNENHDIYDDGWDDALCWVIDIIHAAQVGEPVWAAHSDGDPS